MFRVLNHLLRGLSLLLLTVGGVVAAQAEEVSGKPVAIIDIAHGGLDTGRTGVLNTTENSVLLALVDDLQDLAKDSDTVSLVFTRTEDTQPGAAERQALLAKYQGSIFISLHLAASKFHSESGVTAYYCGTTSEGDLLTDLGEEDKYLVATDANCLGDDIVNQELGREIQAELFQGMKTYYDGFLDQGTKKAPWLVLRGIKNPAIVITLSYLDHPVEGRRLLDRRYRRVLTSSLYQGIEKYFEKRSGLK